jgi:micrococcal nuclease
VTAILDGDTIAIFHEGSEQRIRLPGVPPAVRDKAKQFTGDLVFGKAVTVRVVDTDRYDRLVADVILEDGRSLNRESVKAGLAWWLSEVRPTGLNP